MTLALHGMTPALSDKAFTASSTLLIDRVTLRDSSGIPIDGRRRSATATFSLQMRHRQCLLVQAPTSRQWTLPHARCEPQ